MGFAVSYRSTRPVNVDDAEVIQERAALLCRGRTWLSCEPIKFYSDTEDGHMLGSSKLNFMPHPDDVASAATEGLQDGTTVDLIEVLRQLSRDHDIDWEVRHDYSNGPIGYIRTGECDDSVLSQVEAFADLGDILAGEGDGLDEEDFNAES